MSELRKYSAELKVEAVKMVTEQGLTQEETGKRLSIPKGNIGKLGRSRQGCDGEGQSWRAIGGRAVR